MTKVVIHNYLPSRGKTRDKFKPEDVSEVMYRAGQTKKGSVFETARNMGYSDADARAMAKEAKRRDFEG